MNAVFVDDAMIDRWIAEDAPLLDLTTHLLGVGDRAAAMQWVLRAGGVVACSEEAARIVQRCGGAVTSLVASGQRVAPGGVMVAAQGPAEALLRAWKVAQNLLEHACGIAAATDAMVAAVRAAAPKVAVLTTRKHAPGVKAITLKSTLAGGAFPHRLGVGETVLVFGQHRALIGDWPAVAARLQAVEYAVAEKKIVIEAESLDEALAAVGAGADVVQFDKVSPEELRAWCPLLRERAPHVGVLAAGGIRLDNAVAYATSGVDALVTSSLHYARPADVGVRIIPSQG